jgi:hypothetical protein
MVYKRIRKDLFQSLPFFRKCFLASISTIFATTNRENVF